MGREKRGYRDNLELVSSRVDNRVFIKGSELEMITGLSGNAVRKKFARARVAKGVYTVTEVAWIMSEKNERTM